MSMCNGGQKINVKCIDVLHTDRISTSFVNEKNVINLLLNRKPTLVYIPLQQKCSCKNGTSATRFRTSTQPQGVGEKLYIEK